jgi:hypothetical protein
MAAASVEHFKKAKYLYVVYPGATGGNHVCNMISICEGFGPRVKKLNYKEWMLKKYKRVDYKLKPPKFVNAHVDDNIHHVDRLYEYVDKEYLLNANEKIIIQGHIFNFWSALNEGILSELGQDYVGIVLDYPSEGSMAHDRITVYGYHSEQRQYQFPLEIKLLEYSVKISEDNGFFIDTSKLFTTEGSQYLRELLRDTFELELPPEADEMHKMWFTWMKHVINPEVVEFWKNR